MKLGELLIENGLLTPDQLEKALDAQQLWGGKLGTNLVELGLIPESVLAGFLARQLHMEAANADEFESIPEEVLKLVPRKFLAEHLMIPLRLGQKLRVAISDAQDLSAIDQLGFQTGKPIQAVVAPEIWIVAALERHCQIPRRVRYIAVDDEIEIEGFEITHDLNDPRKAARKPPRPASPDTVSLEVFGQRLLSAQNSSDVFNALMDYLGPITSRMAVYVVRKDHVGGYMLRGFPVHARQFQETRVEFGARSVICRVVEQGSVFQGSYQVSPDEEKIFGILNLAPGTKIELHPIPAFGKTVGAFLGLLDPERSFTKPDAGRLITMICGKAGLALEILSNRQKILKRPAGA